MIKPLRARLGTGGPLYVALLLLSTAVLADPLRVSAQALWVADGVPLCTLPSCYGRQPVLAGDGGGGSVTAWLIDGPTSALYARRLEADGSLAPGWLTSTPGVPITTGQPGQIIYAIAADGSGGAFVVWTDSRNAFNTGTDIYAQHVLVTGQYAPGWSANGLAVCADSANQSYPVAMSDGAGGVFIVWEDARSSGPGIYGEHLNADGSRVAGWPDGGLPIRAIAGSGAGGAAVAPDGQGGCIVAWSDARTGLGNVICAQRLSWFGVVAPGWPANGVILTPGDVVYTARGSAHVVPDRLGGAYVGWQLTHDPYALDDDIYATRVQADGSVAPGWPAAGLAVCVEPSYQSFGDAAADSMGNMLLAWYDQRNYSIQPAVVYMQKLQPDGSLAPGWQLNGNPASDLIGYQFNPQLASDGQGGAFVVYQESFNEHCYMQHMGGSGTVAPGWPSIGVPLVDPSVPLSGQRDMQIVPDGSGGAITVWDDARNSVQDQLYAQRYTGAGPTATLTSLMSFEALPDRVTLTWLRGDDAPLEVSVEREGPSAGWSALAQASFDGSGRLKYEDRSVVPGARYSYRLAWSDASGEYHTAETAVSVPRTVSLALEGLRPNPAIGEAFVAFTLPDAGAATVEVLDIGGRQMAKEEVGGLGAGRHVVAMNAGGTLHPGAYWVRLTHGDRRLMAKGVVLR